MALANNPAGHHWGNWGLEGETSNGWSKEAQLRHFSLMQVTLSMALSLIWKGKLIRTVVIKKENDW